MILRTFAVNAKKGTTSDHRPRQLGAIVAYFLPQGAGLECLEFALGGRGIGPFRDRGDLHIGVFNLVSSRTRVRQSGGKTSHHP